MDEDREIGRQVSGQAFNSAAEALSQGKAIQVMQTNYATAVTVQKPRDLRDVQRRCIEEAELAGDAMYYRWEVESTNKKTGLITKSFIEGPSVNLALAAVRNFGNVVIQQRPLQETKTSWVFTAAFIDLETGFTIERQFRMSKDYKIFGNMDQFRKDDIRFQIGQSKAIRNVVNNAVPVGIINRMLEAAKGSVRRDLEEAIKKRGGDIQKIIEPMLVKLGKVGATVEMIEKKLGLKVTSWDVETLVILSGDLKAIQSGQETADSLYGEDAPEPTATTDNSPNLSDMKPGDPTTHQGYKQPGNGNKADPNLGF